MKRYETLTQTLLGLFITGAYWGESHHESTWSDCLGMIADHKGGISGDKRYINLQDYPALLLMYGAGIAAVAANRYGNLTAVLTRPTRQHPNLQSETPLADLLTADVVIDPDITQMIINPEKKNYTSVSDYLALFLRDAFRDIIPREATFDACFDRFEYLWSLVRVDLRSLLDSHSRWIIGRYMWRDVKHYDSQRTELANLYAEIDAEGENWAGFRAGLFGGSLIRLQFARQKFDEALPKLRQSLGIW